MGKKRRRVLTPKALISTLENGELGDVAEEQKGERFFACYLLTSLCPRFKGQTYIGFTVNPRRRIRQHNGEIGSGAWRTKRKRPWEMVLCIYGFPTNVAALQFEWAWQHPVKSLAVRAAAASFKSVSGLANKIKLAHTMLTLPAWKSLNLTMNFFSTKYQMYTSGCPTLPDQMRTQVCSMDELPCYKGNAPVTDELEGDEECYLGGSFQASPTRQSMGVMRTVNDSSSNHNSSEANLCIQQMSQNDDSSCEISEWSDETWREQLRSSTPGREDNHERPFCRFNNDSLIRETSSFVDCVDDGLKRFRQGSTETVDSCLGCRHRSSFHQESWHSRVEVIDIFTTSPSCTVNSVSKKRKLTAYPEIIDLTNDED